ncbi:unnamed protein product, partial [Rotaria magnacalcarata]
YAVSGAYRYVGCYQNVFHDSFFVSSYMEPTLCFRLCETPMIYLQGKVCRCAGSGLMGYDRQRDSFCSTPCDIVISGPVKTNTCGGRGAHSVYAEEQFYTRHAHLLSYNIKFSSCQLWKTSGYYHTVQVEIDESSTNSSLSKLERCAAACLDRNATTKSIGFNADSNRCLCIISPKANLGSDRALYLKTVSNSKCDRRCDNILGDSKVKHNFQCGSLSNQRIWAIYDLNYACPIDSVYVEEFQKCVFAEKGYRSNCSSPSMDYVYDGNITWNAFLRIVKKLHLTKSMVSINFDNNVTIDSSWKCSNTGNFNFPSTTSIYENSNTNYVLNRGCLLVMSGFSYLYRLSDKLCVEDPLNKDSISKNPMTDAFYIPTFTLMNNCPMNWFDLNGNCYRMSTKPKTIQEASVSCINKPIVEAKDNEENIIFSDDDDDDVWKETNDENKNYMANFQNGEIVQYTSEWQARLGYYLLDTNMSNIQEMPQPIISFDREMPTLAFNINISRPSINEFQMIHLNETNNSTVKDDSCILSTRSVIDEKESSVISNAQMNNCSKPRHVLCKTRSPSFRSHEYCLSKPLTLGLPTIISNYLSYELCVTICVDLKTNSAVLNKNKCYCLNADYSKMVNNKLIYEKYRTKYCGNFCPGTLNRQL